jgi:hypothetical protein
MAAGRRSSYLASPRAFVGLPRPDHPPDADSRGPSRLSGCSPDRSPAPEGGLVGHTAMDELVDHGADGAAR